MFVRLLSECKFKRKSKSAHTIVNVICCLGSQTKKINFKAKLPKGVWVAAISTAVFAALEIFAAPALRNP